MNRKIIIIAIIILLSVLLFLGCVTSDKYKTYRLAGIPLNHETTFILLSWIYTTDDDGQELKVINKTNNTREFQIFDFAISENIIESNNGKLIWGEPYTLWMNFLVYDAKKVIVNKLIFRSKNKVIDIRNNIGLFYLGKKAYSDEGGLLGEIANFRKFESFSEEELINFRNSGMLDVSNLNNENRIIERIQFVYDNLDVVFKKDRFFTIECDITFDSEIEGIEQENYSFVAKFNRIQYTEEKISLLLYLFLKSRI
jgi:hypothetical protein